MKTCRECGRNFPDEYGFCLDDGSTLSEPLAGEETAVLKGPYVPGVTERMPPGDTAPPTPGGPGPAPTEASPLPTIASPPQWNMAGHEPPERHRQPVTRWHIAGLLLIVLTGAAGLVWLLQPGPPPPVPDINTQPGISTSANGSPQPAVSPSATPGANSSPADLGPATSTVTGLSRAETVEEPIVAQYKRGFINRWLVREGDLIQPCGRDKLADATNYIDQDQIGAPPKEISTSDEVRFNDAAIVIRLDVAEKQIYYQGQRIALVGKVVHMWVSARASGSLAARLSRGTSAFFTDAETRRLYNGVVESVDRATGDIRIRLDDNEVFDRARPGCLNLPPDRSGEVSFAISNMTAN